MLGRGRQSNPPHNATGSNEDVNTERRVFIGREGPRGHHEKKRGWNICFVKSNSGSYKGQAPPQSSHYSSKTTRNIGYGVLV